MFWRDAFAFFTEHSGSRLTSETFRYLLAVQDFAQTQLEQHFENVLRDHFKLQLLGFFTLGSPSTLSNKSDDK